MFIIIGIIIVFSSVLGGYMAMGGKLYVLWQPFEIVIIGGAAIGGYIISNTKTILIDTGAAIKAIVRGPKYNKKQYMELLGLMFILFKVAKTKGMLTLETHVENPEESSIFSQVPSILKNHEALHFLCDYLRLLTMGSENPHHMEDLMTEEIEVIEHEKLAVAHAVQYMGDSTPALGIVAAVLGVIKTMGSITEPPEVLGKLIGGALVGTFLGVLLAYGLFGPMANSMTTIYKGEMHFLTAIKVAIIAYMNGYAPTIAIEFARKTLPEDVRPSFSELEDFLNELPEPQL